MSATTTMTTMLAAMNSSSSSSIPPEWGNNPSSESAHMKPLVQRRTVVIAHTHQIQNEFLLNNIILLLVACVGAFILLAVNLIGVVCFRGYFKKRARSSPYIDCPQSLSHVRRCRYPTLLHHFSDDAQANIELVATHHSLMSPSDKKDYSSRRAISFALPSTITSNVQRSHSHTDQLNGTHTELHSAHNSFSVLPQTGSLSCRELSHVGTTHNSHLRHTSIILDVNSD